MSSAGSGRARRFTGAEVTGPLCRQAPACEPILRALPDWFGIERSIEHYVEDIDGLPTFLARVEDRVVGFLTVKVHNAYSAELYVMGVLAEAHRRGIGRALLQRAEAYLRGCGCEYLQVKTLGPSRPDRHYERTRAFYLAMGFRPMEEFGGFWDKDNPCLLMVKYLS